MYNLTKGTEYKHLHFWGIEFKETILVKLIAYATLTQNRLRCAVSKFHDVLYQAGRYAFQKCKMTQSFGHFFNKTQKITTRRM